MPFYTFDRYGYCAGGPYSTWDEAVSALARYENLIVENPIYQLLQGTIEEYDENFNIQQHNAAIRRKFQSENS